MLLPKENCVMSIKKYPIAVERPKSESEAYGVHFPDIPGCFSAGETLDKAIAEAKEALIGFFELASDDGEAIPEASDIESHINRSDFTNYIWSFVEIDTTPFLGKSKKINVTLPEYLIKRIDDVASTNPVYKSRSGFLAAAAERALETC